MADRPRSVGCEAVGVCHNVTELLVAWLVCVRI
jgi:hypothetical protein